MKKSLRLFLFILCLLSLLGCNHSNEHFSAMKDPDLALIEEINPTVAGWDLIRKEGENITPGVNYIYALFHDAEGLPHVADILTVDPNKATLYKGTSRNGMEISPADKQNVLEHMQASVSDGLNVVAAVNGDFFGINSSYMPSGVSVKNGTILRDNNSFRPFCAITKDGEYIISDGSRDKVDLSTLQMATGGSHVLIRKGQLYDVYQDSAFSTTSHPRTLSGIREDKIILLVVIDGRQQTLSNGATLLQCGMLMQSLGAVEAINHDGGAAIK